MKDSYVYLSPDGQYILEINKYVPYMWDIIGYEEHSPDKADHITEISSSDFQKLFSSWEYLGEL